MWKLHQHGKSQPTSEHAPQYQSSEEVAQAKHAKERAERIKVLDDLNVRACTHVTKYLHENKKSTLELVDVNIDEQIQNIDQQLWEAVCMLTRSMSERNDPSGVSDKALQFILCTIMFCSNEDFTIPLHNLITDVVDGQGCLSRY